MANQSTTQDILAELVALTHNWGEANQPQPLFAGVSQFLKKHCGYKLLTFLLEDGQEVARLFTNMPDAYPLSGRKLMGPTGWGDLLIGQGKAFLGRDSEAIKWAFFDHELIASLGLGSVISVPIRYDNQTIGVISMLDEEFYYQEKHQELAQQAAVFLAPAFMQAAFSARLAK